MFYIDSDPYGICHAGFFMFMRVCGLLSRRATEDGEGAELGAVADLVPGRKLGFPVEGPHRFAQPFLDGPAGDEGHRQPPAFVLGGLLEAPLHILGLKCFCLFCVIPVQL